MLGATIRSRKSRRGVFLVAGTLWLLLAAPGQAHSPPTLTSAGVDAQNHLTATWTMSAGDDPWSLIWTTNSATEDPGYPPGRGLRLVSQTGASLPCSSCTSFVSSDSLDAGTYYVQVVIDGPHEGSDYTVFHYSNIMSVTVPESGGGGGGGGGGTPPTDTDGDGVADSSDNCPTTWNADQTNTDGDTQGDACDLDDDNDGVADSSDNCPITWNASQTNTDGDTRGDACDSDDDNDGAPDAFDACPTVAAATFDGCPSSGAGLGIPGLSATALDETEYSTVIHADGTSEPLGENPRALSKGDTIKTGRYGSVEVLFSDGSMVEIGPRGSFTLALDRKRGFTLTRGAILASFRQALCRLKKGNVCRMRTTNGVIAVRGTTFSAEATKRVTRVRTYKGAVALRNTRGKRKRTVVVRKGFEGTVRGAKPPTLARAG